ncbi:MAG: hypothetical protein ACYCQJ_03600 [Nitrososphaerales archaeon]
MSRYLKLAAIVEALIIILLMALGMWYYFVVQSEIQYTGDPTLDPYGYHTLYIFGTSTSNYSFTIEKSMNGFPTANFTSSFIVNSSQMNSFLELQFSPCASLLYVKNTSRDVPFCVGGAKAEVFVTSNVCTAYRGYNLAFEMDSNILYDSGNVSAQQKAGVRLSIGYNCLIFEDTGNTSLSMITNSKLFYTSISSLPWNP